MNHYTAADLPDWGWTTISESLFIGPSPYGLVDTDDVARAVQCIQDGLPVNVSDSRVAVEILVSLGLDQEQAEKQVGWANGQGV